VWRWVDTGDWACGCWACGFGPGDVFDFLRKRDELSLSEAVVLAGQLADQNLPAPELPEVEEIGYHDLSAILRYATPTQTALAALFQTRRIELPLEWPGITWGVVSTADEVLIPHWNAANELIAVKRRWPPSWTPVAVRGSQLTALYGAWRDRGEHHVIVCEGESDAWSVSWWRRHDPHTLVVALPSGAAAKPTDQLITPLRGRRVTLLFDADVAGRLAAETWRCELPDVAVATLPNGTDATSAGEAVVTSALTNAVIG